MIDAITDPNIGERATRGRWRRFATVYGVLFAGGAASGFALAMVEREQDFLIGPIPPAAALILIGVWLAMIVGSSIWFHRNADEVERAINRQAMAIGGSFVLVGYPVWYLLWRGEMAPEPIHWVMFLALYLVMAIAYAVKKFR